MQSMTKIKPTYVSKRKPWELPKTDKNKQPGQGRKATNQWFYQSKAWRRHRKIGLAMEPFCVKCKERGIITSANTRDHIHRINPINPYDTQDGRYGEPLDFANEQSLCTRCHNKKSAQEAHEKI